MLAYDRPSHKFLSFLRKHWGLVDYYPQSNNFVVYKDYFDTISEENLIKKEREQYNTRLSAVFNPYHTHTTIAQKQRQGTGVFSALGSQLMQRTELVQKPRNLASPYEKFQGIIR